MHSSSRLAEALKKSYERELDQFLDTVDIQEDYVFSENFEKNMDRILKRQGKPFFNLMCKTGYFSASGSSREESNADDGIRVVYANRRKEIFRVVSASTALFAAAAGGFVLMNRGYGPKPHEVAVPADTVSSVITNDFKNFSSSETESAVYENKFADAAVSVSGNPVYDYKYIESEIPDETDPDLKTEKSKSEIHSITESIPEETTYSTTPPSVSSAAETEAQSERENIKEYMDILNNYSEYTPLVYFFNVEPGNKFILSGDYDSGFHVETETGEVIFNEEHTIVRGRFGNSFHIRATAGEMKKYIMMDIFESLEPNGMSGLSQVPNQNKENGKYLRDIADRSFEDDWIPICVAVSKDYSEEEAKAVALKNPDAEIFNVVSDTTLNWYIDINVRKNDVYGFVDALEASDRVEAFCFLPFVYVED